MKILVHPHELEIIQEPINEKQIDVTKCEFVFDEEITEDFVKDVYFTYEDTTYKMANIQNNECKIPYEVIETIGQVEIGVVAYLVENEEEIKRYNPRPAYFNSWLGSLKEEFENSESVTPTDKEQFQQMLQTGLNNINEAINNAENLDIDMEKVDNVATITITRQDGIQKSEEIYDGEKGSSGIVTFNIDNNGHLIATANDTLDLNNYSIENGHLMLRIGE